jgi:Spy/CpxP family protein refolding chaperone
MVNNKRKAQLIIIAAFTLGIVVGASGQYLFLYKSLSKPTNSNQEVLDSLTREVKLTNVQRRQVEQIMNDSQAKYQELRIQTRPQYDAVRNETRKRISSILTPEQLSLYEQRNRRLDAERLQKEKSSTGK